MAADPRLKNLRGSGRREFLRWATVIAATLGVDRSRFLNVLNDGGGTALADTASGSTTMKSVHLIGDNGGLSWFTQLFPYPTVAKAGVSGSAYYSTPTATLAGPTDMPSVYSPASPFQKLSKAKQMSAFVVGTNETHTKTPTSALALGTSNLLAVASAIQTASPTLLPVMAINPFSFGTAPGAATPATVANAAGLVDLFNSAASQTLLQAPANAAIGESYFKAFLDLNAAAPRSAVQSVYATGRVATNLLAKNLASQLAVTPADMIRYGMTASTPTTVSEIGNAMCIAVKAFSLGLTNCLILPAMQDDPHGAFAEHGDAPLEREDARANLRRLHGRLHGPRRSGRRERHAGRQRRHHDHGRYPEGRAHRIGLAGQHGVEPQSPLRDGERLPEDGLVRRLERGEQDHDLGPEHWRPRDDDERAALHVRDVGGGVRDREGGCETGAGLQRDTAGGGDRSADELGRATGEVSSVRRRAAAGRGGLVGSQSKARSGPRRLRR